jgi:hypothetical protein
MVWVVAIRAHSPLTFFRSRSRKQSIPRAPLICPIPWAALERILRSIRPDP